MRNPLSSNSLSKNLLLDLVTMDHFNRIEMTYTILFLINVLGVYAETPETVIRDGALNRDNTIHVY